MNNEQTWEHLNRMQKNCMDKGSLVTRYQYFNEPVEERREFYNWMRKQVNEFIAGPYWDGNDADTRMLYGGYDI